MGAGAAPAPLVIYGPHCSHDECSWITCDETGLVEFCCTKPGCPYCGALRNEPEDWAGDPARFAAMTPAEQDRARAYWAQYPLRRRSPDDTSGRLSDAAGDGEDRPDHDDYEPCTHECDELCELEGCLHEHCGNCGGCNCPGYCDDYQTYNLRPGETGGARPPDPGGGP